jgi:hypothetical protein
VEDILYSNEILCALFKKMDHRATLDGASIIRDGFFAFVGAQWNQASRDTEHTHDWLRRLFGPWYKRLAHLTIRGSLVHLALSEEVLTELSKSSKGTGASRNKTHYKSELEVCIICFLPKISDCLSLFRQMRARNEEHEVTTPFRRFSSASAAYFGAPCTTCSTLSH